MDQNELNEVGTLLHIMETIVTNHPKLAGIARTCQRRLEEINKDHLEREAAPKQFKEYPKVVTPPAGPENSAIQRQPGGTLEQISADKRTDGEKLMDQPIEELPEGDQAQVKQGESNAPVERRV